MSSPGLEVCERSGGDAPAVENAAGVRVIYYNRPAHGEFWLLLIYGKSVRDNIPAHVLRQIKEEIEDA
jgi:hypothetical protein